MDVCARGIQSAHRGLVVDEKQQRRLHAVWSRPARLDFSLRNGSPRTSTLSSANPTKSRRIVCTPLPSMERRARHTRRRRDRTMQLFGNSEIAEDRREWLRVWTSSLIWTAGSTTVVAFDCGFGLSSGSTASLVLKKNESVQDAPPSEDHTVYSRLPIPACLAILQLPRKIGALHAQLAQEDSFARVLADGLEDQAS